MKSNDTFLRALRREAVDFTPVWIMRQAGRYLPEYRATRASAGGIIDLFRSPQLACEVTMQPLQRFDLDAAILFSDILTIPDAMGLGLYFEEGEGPRFRAPVQDAQAIERLQILKPEAELPYVLDAVKLIRQELNERVPLIGFSGSPWTLATYMVEGGSSKDFARIKTMVYNAPELMHVLLEKLARSVAAYLRAQIVAGAQAVQIFDTWGGVLSDVAYEEFSLRYMRAIVHELKQNAETADTPIIIFTKNGGLWLEDIAATGCDALGLDWTCDIGRARARVDSAVALQGNMDPAILRSSPERIVAEVKRILGRYGSGSGHVFNLGHGITPDIKPDHVKALVDAVHEHSGANH